MGFPGGTSGKGPPCDAGDIRDKGSIPGSGRSRGGGHGNPLQCSCLESPMDRGTWGLQNIIQILMVGLRSQALCYVAEKLRQAFLRR